MELKTFVARRDWVLEEGLRLDAAAYVTGGLQAHDQITQSGAGWRPLGGISRMFYGGRTARRYVLDPTHGTPFLSSSDILLADLKGVSLVSTLGTPDLGSLMLQGGWTLITRSGTVGNTAYVRGELVGMAASEHVIRVVPDLARVYPGFLFAFLSSTPGQMMIKQKTFGSIVQHIDPHHIADIPVPLPDPVMQERIHALVDGAAKARTEAAHLLDAAAAYFDGLAGPMPSRHDHARATDVVCRARLAGRLDAFHHVGWAIEAGSVAGTPVGDLADVTRPGIFKRIFVARGVPLVSGIDVFQVRVGFRERLMRAEAERADNLLQQGQILVQRSGQRYGLLDRPAYVTSEMEGWAASEDLMCITPHNADDAGRVFAFLRSEIGHRTVLRGSYGTSIPHLNPPGLSAVQVPDLPANLEAKSLRALHMREQADIDEQRAIQEVEAWVG